jgi:hypothetical protein
MSTQTEKVDPRLVALKQQQADLQDLLDHRGWQVYLGLARTLQVREEGVLRSSKESQEIFQAQGVFRLFDSLNTAIKELCDADEEALKMMLPAEEET